MFYAGPVLLLGAYSFPNLGGVPITAVISVLSLIIVIGLIGGVLYKEWQSETANPMTVEMRGVSFFFWLEMAYLAMLFAIGAVYVTCWPDQTQIFLIGGLVPCAVPWFGALGAVLIGLVGVFMHNKEWDSKYNYWHIARPFVGAVLGFVAFFIMVLLIRSSGNEPKFLVPGQENYQPIDCVLFYVLAFLVGYREETFRELMKRGTDLILAPRPSTSPGSLVPLVTFQVDGVAETSFDFGKVQVNTKSPKKIVVQNSGTADLQAAEATIINDPPGSVEFQLDASTNPLNGAAVLTRGGIQIIEVTFTPTTANKFTATLTVKGTNMSSQIFKLSGEGIDTAAVVNEAAAVVNEAAAVVNDAAAAVNDASAAVNDAAAAVNSASGAESSTSGEGQGS